MAIPPSRPALNVPTRNIPVKYGSGPGTGTPIYIPPVNPRVIGSGPGTGPPIYIPPVVPRTNPSIGSGTGTGHVIRIPNNEVTPPPATNPPPATPTPPPSTVARGNPNKIWGTYLRKRRGLGPRTTTSVTPEMIRRAAAMRMSS